MSDDKKESEIILSSFPLIEEKGEMGNYYQLELSNGKIVSYFVPYIAFERVRRPWNNIYIEFLENKGFIRWRLYREGGEIDLMI